MHPHSAPLSSRGPIVTGDEHGSVTVYGGRWSLERAKLRRECAITGSRAIPSAVQWRNWQTQQVVNLWSHWDMGVRVPSDARSPRLRSGASRFPRTPNRAYAES